MTTYSTDRREYRMDELDLSTPGPGPLHSRGIVTSGIGHKIIGPGVGSIDANDVYPWKGKELLLAQICVAEDSHGSGDAAYFGIGGAWNADPTAIVPFVGFRINDSKDVEVYVNDGVNPVQVSATGFTLANDRWSVGTIDFYSGVMSQSMPNPSIGGLGHIKFGFENDNGQAQRVGADIGANLSAYEETGLQLILTTTGTGNSLLAKFAAVEYRDKMGPTL